MHGLGAAVVFFGGLACAGIVADEHSEMLGLFIAAISVYAGIRLARADRDRSG